MAIQYTNRSSTSKASLGSTKDFRNTNGVIRSYIRGALVTYYVTRMVATTIVIAVFLVVAPFLLLLQKILNSFSSSESYLSTRRFAGHEKTFGKEEPGKEYTDLIGWAMMVGDKAAARIGILLLLILISFFAFYLHQEDYNILTITIAIILFPLFAPLIFLYVLISPFVLLYELYNGNLAAYTPDIIIWGYIFSAHLLHWLTRLFLKHLGYEIPFDTPFNWVFKID